MNKNNATQPDKEVRENFEKVAFALLEGDSVKEIAKKAGISPATVYRYLKNEEFQKYLEELVAKEIKRSEATIWRRLLNMCESGDLSAMKLYFELSGIKKNSAETTSGVRIIDDVPKVSKAEIEKLYGKLAGDV